MLVALLRLCGDLSVLGGARMIFPTEREREGLRQSVEALKAALWRAWPLSLIPKFVDWLAKKLNTKRR